MLRKIYPYINPNLKNIRWRNLNDTELEQIMQDKQVLANCYENSVIHSLLLTKNGKEIIKKFIKVENKHTDDPAYKASFHINNKKKKYRCGISDYYGKYLPLYGAYYGGVNELINSEKHTAPLDLGISILTAKMIKNNPEQKPLITRLYKFPLITNLSCERNKPSNTFKWLTGRNPVSIGETEINLSLKKYAEDVRKLLKSFNCQKDCFVVMSGFKKVGDIDTWHCLPVIKTDSKQETVTLLNKRDNKLKTYTFEELINNFKAVVGIKNI